MTFSRNYVKLAQTMTGLNKVKRKPKGQSSMFNTMNRESTDRHSMESTQWNYFNLTDMIRGILAVILMKGSLNYSATFHSFIIVEFYSECKM